MPGAVRALMPLSAYLALRAGAGDATETRTEMRDRDRSEALFWPAKRRARELVTACSRQIGLALLVRAPFRDGNLID